MKLLSTLLLFALSESASSNRLRGLKKDNTNKNKAGGGSWQLVPPSQTCCTLYNNGQQSLSCVPAICNAVNGNNRAGEDRTVYTITITNQKTGEKRTTTVTSGTTQDETAIGDEDETPTGGGDNRLDDGETGQPHAGGMCTMDNFDEEGCTSDDDCISGCCADMTPNSVATATMLCIPMDFTSYGNYQCRQAGGSNQCVSANRDAGEGNRTPIDEICTYSIPEFGTGPTTFCQYGCQCEPGLFCAGHPGIGGGVNGACMSEMEDGFSPLPSTP